MSTALSPGMRRSHDIVALMARGLLGLLLIYLGLSKVLHPADFAKFVRGQPILAHPFLASVFLTTAPWLEVLYGLLLLSGFFRRFAALVARWWLACVFIYMGLNKALPYPEHFLKLVQEYRMVDTPWLLNSIAAVLPWFEAYCGILLLLGVAVRGSALTLIAMLVPFTAIVFKRALEIAATKHLAFCAVKFDCGCGAGEVFICHKLVENSVLLLLATWLLAGGGRQCCLLFSVFRPNHDPLKQSDVLAPAVV
jgi:uncharacterized membrane protein YphA (DoxX/SURF4 family)